MTARTLLAARIAAIGSALVLLGGFVWRSQQVATTPVRNGAPARERTVAPSSKLTIHVGAKLIGPPADVEIAEGLPELELPLVPPTLKPGEKIPPPPPEGPPIRGEAREGVIEITWEALVLPPSGSSPPNDAPMLGSGSKSLDRSMFIRAWHLEPKPSPTEKSR